MGETAVVSDEATLAKPPLLRRILVFPLVALLLGLLAFGLMVGIAGGIAFVLAQALGIEMIQDVPDWFGTYLRPVMLTIGSILVLKLAIRRLGAQKRDDLPFDARSRDFLTGIVLAALLMSLIVAVSALLGGYRMSGWGGSTSWLWLVLTAGFQAAFFEEILFRGVIFRFLEEFAGSWIALLLSALLFGFVHYGNPNATLFSSLAIAIEAGVLLGGAYMLTRNLWLAIGIHWGWNVTQGYVWDISVSGIAVDGLVQSQATGNPLISGGAFGVEASLIALILATGAGIAMLWLSAKRGRIVGPIWSARGKEVIEH